MKILIDASNLVNKAFAALLYMEMERLKKNDKSLENVDKDVLKKLALKTVNKEFVLHTAFNMIDTIMLVLSGKLNDIVLVFDDVSWRKKFLEEFNSQEEHEINGKSYKLKNQEIDYKAGRDKIGKDVIHGALDDMYEISKQIKMKNFKKNKFEADDIIGLITFELKDEDIIYISSNDKDFYQLMQQENVRMYNSTTKDVLHMSVEEASNYFKSKLLIKDLSDNIDNVIPEFYFNDKLLPSMMLGDKTANSLVEEHNDMDKILDAISEKIFNNQNKYFKKLNRDEIVSADKDSENFIKKSIVLNDNEEPIELYHGTTKYFENFDNNYIGVGNDESGSGFYFTNNIETANNYGEHLKKVFLNIKNPILDNSKEPSFEEIKNLIIKAPKYKKTLEDFTDFKDPSFDLNKTIDDTAKSYLNMDLLYTLNVISNDFYDKQEHKFLKNVTKFLGYDGVIITKGEEKHYVVFDSKQIRESKNCKFGKRYKNPYTFEDVRNVVQIYFNRNEKMMSFKKIPQNLINEFNEFFDINEFNDLKVVENSKIKEVFENFKLNNLSKKYETNNDEDLYSDM